MADSKSSGGSKFEIGKIGLALGGATAGALALGALSNHVIDIMKQRYLKLNSPTWEIQGEAKKWGQNGGTARYVKGQEVLTDKMYEIPAELIKNQVLDRGQKALDMPGKMYDRYKINKNFEQIRTDPSVQAMGEAKARAMYSQVAKISPDIIRKAPSAALPAIQNALLTDSAGLRADYVYNMARAQQAIK